MGIESKIPGPCAFGVTLQQGVQLIASINIIFGVWGLIVISLYCLILGDFFDAMEDNGGSRKSWLMAWWIFIGIVVIISSVVNYLLLFRAAAEKSAKKIKIYLIISLVFAIFNIIGSMVTYFSFATILASLIGHLPLAYELWVIFCFYKQILNPDQYNGQTGGSDPYDEP